jgi:hypothetical protein
MGYNLYITRGLHWSDEDSANPISLEEWKNYVANDPEMRLDNYALTDMPGQGALETWREGLSVWTAYSQDGLNGNHAWFRYSGGNIDVKNPDDEIISKMLIIADALQAKVQGDEGEFYEENDYNKIVIKQPEESNHIITPTSPGMRDPITRKPWWKFW